VQQGLAQPLHDPPVELRITCYHLDLDPLPERIGEFACMSGQALQKGLQRLHLEVKERIELAFGETAQDALATLELHRHLPQRRREGGQHLAWSAFADASLREGREPEDSVCEAFRSHSHDPQSCAAIGEVIHQFRRNADLLPPPTPRFGGFLSGSPWVVASRLLLITSACERLETLRDLCQALLELPRRHQLRRLQQVLRPVAELGHLTKAHHPTGAFQGVQLPADLHRGIHVFVHGVEELVEQLNPVSRLLEKEGAKIVVDSQIFIQFRRLISTPRVPIIVPAASWTATAIVKHGSPVSSES